MAMIRLKSDSLGRDSFIDGWFLVLALTLARILVLNTRDSAGKMPAGPTAKMAVLRR